MKNYRKLYEAEQSRANRNAAAYRLLCREVEHASTIASDLHESMQRDNMGAFLPPYARLAILANKQAANAAYLFSLRQEVK